jgi:hypothetical protein
MDINPRKCKGITKRKWVCSTCNRIFFIKSSKSQGDNKATQYTIRTSTGSAIQVITDQSEILVGDCVLVEETANSANVRRKDPAMCKPAPKEVMSQVEAELHDDASQCDAAKQKLFAAKTTEEVAVAKQVMEILCND